ncbi:MAG TPA: hypothetical protein GXZ51_02110 [Acholeplasma sp.]|jgi:hypothetical protein|nr:hypothetical protein [Acholeplasma sp.]
MFQKLKRGTLLVVFLLLGFFLVGCSCDDNNKEIPRTYVADGIYLEYKTIDTNNKPLISTVAVTIKNDAIDSVYIDCVDSEEVVVDGVVDYKLKAKSRKELGYLFGLYNQDELASGYQKQDLNTEEGLQIYKDYLLAQNKKEWFEQANLLEAYFKTGNSVLELDNGYITSIEGVNIKDIGFSELFVKAVANAKAGIFKAIKYVNNYDIISVVAKVSKAKKVEKITLDVVSGKTSAGVFKFDVESRLTMKYAYGMYNSNNPEYEYTKQDLTTAVGLETYRVYLEQSHQYEWFQQSTLLTNYVLSNGFSKLKLATDGEHLEEGLIEGVIMPVGDYYKLMNVLNKYMGRGLG